MLSRDADNSRDDIGNASYSLLIHLSTCKSRDMFVNTCRRVNQEIYKQNMSVDFSKCSLTLENYTNFVPRFQIVTTFPFVDTHIDIIQIR